MRLGRKEGLCHFSSSSGIAADMEASKKAGLVPTITQWPAMRALLTGTHGGRMPFARERQRLEFCPEINGGRG